MPNFQMGIIAALSRFAVELADQVARTRGSSQIDRDLDTASGLLKYPGTVWIFDFRTSFAPTASSESPVSPRRWPRCATTISGSPQGQALFETRADNLQATLERMAADIGSSSAALDQQLEDTSLLWPDFAADDLFYATKGRLYAYYLLLRALEADFANVIAERGLRGGLAADAGELPRRGRSCSPGSSSTARRTASWRPATSPPRGSSCCAGAPSLGKSPTSCLNNRSGGSWGAARRVIGRCCRLNDRPAWAMVEACRQSVRMAARDGPPETVPRRLSGDRKESG